MNNECAVCHGPLELQYITFTQWLHGRLIVIEHVPALVCETCGETYYAPDVVDRIQAVLASSARPDRTLLAEVYDLPA